MVDVATSIWDLVLGGEQTVRDVLNNTLSVTIPPRTQPGTIFRLKGRGLTLRSGQSGDLLVRVQAQIPDYIAPELLEHIKQFRGQ